MNALQGEDDGQESVIGVLDGKGKRDPALLVSEIGTQKILSIYKTMMLNRVFDTKVLSLQRQGRLGAFIASTGEEAASVGSAYAMEKTDWMISSYRESGAHLARGLSVDLMFAQLFGNSNDLLKGRQMSNSWGSRELNNIPTAAPIGAYLPIAVGVGMAAKLSKKRVGVLTYMGDGGTSASDFHTAMNFAGVYRAPVVFICRNNGWAISLPVSKQTASKNMAIKAIGYGFEGILVDGNDPLAMHLETRKALERAKDGQGPTLIEARTYRIGPHSTADDPSRYRESGDSNPWEKKDPIARLRGFLMEQKLWNQDLEGKLAQELEQIISVAVERQEATRPRSVQELYFDDVYADLPWFLKEQKDELSAHLQRE